MPIERKLCMSSFDLKHVIIFSCATYLFFINFNFDQYISNFDNQIITFNKWNHFIFNGLIMVYNFSFLYLTAHDTQCAVDLILEQQGQREREQQEMLKFI